MDIISHVILSGIVSNGNPIAIIGSIIPDLSMIKRKEKPDKYYIFMHSLLSAGLSYLINPYLCLGHLTHIILDFFTHGEIFSPKLFYPFSNWNCKLFKEWEFFNFSFFIGIFIIFFIIIIKGVIAYGIR